MIIRDVIYGEFELPDFLGELVVTPEFRRLSEVRLLNINSPTLAALADVSRYSHTLGVLYLAMKNGAPTLSEEENKAFLSALVVHDAGTPAFAHLFEYMLLDRFGWDHESVVPSLLSAQHHPDDTAHQIYASQIPRFEKVCSNVGVDFELVLAMLQGKHPASRLIFGSLDFDNLDNVARMNWMLGNRFEVESISSLASAIGIGSRAEVELPKTQRPNLELWANLRRNAYEVLIFDGPTVAGQAVLSRAITDALDDKTLSNLDWVYTDRNLIDAIRKDSRDGKRRLDQDFFGKLPTTLLMLHITDPDHRLHSLSRENLANYVEEFLGTKLGVTRPYGYVFRDRGAFSKQIMAIDPKDREPWSFGEKSNSLVVYGFGNRQASRSPAQLGSDFEAWILRKIA